MARGRKMTMREVEDQLKDTRLYIGQFSQAVSMDIHRLNVILFSYLKEVGAAEEIVCPSCKQEILIPLIEGLERETHCPSCNAPLDEGQQSLDDYTEEE
jgi:hypothetical protein